MSVGRMKCTYCGSSPAEGHKGFCLTRMEAAREEWIPGIDPDHVKSAAGFSCPSCGCSEDRPAPWCKDPMH